jgi:uncharacterized Zn finger protein (UPF0148 family)
MSQPPARSPGPPRQSVIEKCASCGSRETRFHAGATVCAYCRSTLVAAAEHMIDVTTLADEHPRFVPAAPPTRSIRG